MFNFSKLAEENAVLHPDETALIILDGDGNLSSEVSWFEFVRRMHICAGGLRTLASQGDRVVIWESTQIEFIVVLFACMSSGMIAVPTPAPESTTRGGTRTSGILADCQPSLLVLTDAQHDSLLDSIQLPNCVRAVSVEDIETACGQPADNTLSVSTAFLQYTSGSTTRPKGVMVSHENLLANIDSIRITADLSATDVVGSWLPLFHDMGLIGTVLLAVRSAIPCILMNRLSFIRKPVRWLQMITEWGITYSGGPNFAYELCASNIRDKDMDKLDLSRWRIAFSGAEPVRASTMLKFQEKFASIGFSSRSWVPGYGLAENTLVVSNVRFNEHWRSICADRTKLYLGVVDQQKITGSNMQETVGCGRPCPNIDVAIVDSETGVQLGENQIGEIWVAGDSVAKGYWNQSDNLTDVFRRKLPGNNKTTHLATGDLGYMDSGELFVTGRVKDLIMIKARKLFAEDIEEHVRINYPMLRANSTAAFSFRDDTYEHLILVQGVSAATSDLESLGCDIASSVRDAFDAKVNQLLFVRNSQIPKTTSGKIQRSKCRTQYFEGTIDPLFTYGEEVRN